MFKLAAVVVALVASAAADDWAIVATDVLGRRDCHCTPSFDTGRHDARILIDGR
jgi:hypothetical protein